jgi:tetratricopeptide (TPR) repeat protein|tara:strand:+ start:406 stop:843 length:438 start_codon:yes stop_codon:yes gene_type:complete
MKKKNVLIILISFILLNFSLVYANSKDSYFENGKKLFDNKNYKDSKFYFEKDIVFNPKSENSYLYLAKIFKEEKKLGLEENNLNTVLLINPKNEEAIYLLALLNIKNSNFSKAKELIKTLNSVCEKMCSSRVELQSRLAIFSKSE